MVVSQEATLKDLNDEIEAMDAKKTVAEESLSSLNLKMDAVTNERDGLASELQSTVKELESLRGELNLIRSGTDSLSHSSSSSELDSSQDMDNFSSSREGIRKILESSKITREDIDFICSSMDKAKATITELGKERKTLKKEVKRLRAALEQSQGELKTVKKNCKVMNQQTISLRGDVNQAKSLLKENEAEKNRLSSALQAAHEAMDEIHRCSSESYNALVHQSQHEISMLKSELESKDEAIEQLHALHNEHVSKFDITSDSIQSSQPSVVTSAERFKVEKGQSMLGILKGRRTKRKDKDQLSYRKKK
jgi:chromosome segregation ATPase